ncbi:hypothetical protein ACC808_37560, partial [Rhizobium ruizarguesonis]
MAVLGSLNLLKKRLPADERIERLVTNAIQAAERGTALTHRLGEKIFDVFEQQEEFDCLRLELLAACEGKQALG